MGKVIYAADLFCGAGGTSSGLKQAVEKIGYDLRLVAVNHWEVAVETHAANHPQAEHFCTGLDAMQPFKAIPGKKLDLLMASPECIHHSKAKAGKPRDDQSRSSAWHVLHWCQQLYVRKILIENVPEFTEWGPLDAEGYPLKSRKGQTFQGFLFALQSLGYSIDWKIITCADYGDATTRERFFLLANRGNRRPVWPAQSHARTPGQIPNSDLLDPVLKPWRPAKDIIDWSIPGHSLFLSAKDVKRAGLRIKRPLVENTIRRIEAGIQRFWGDWAEPFLVVLRGTNDNQLDNTCRSIDEPIPALTAGGGHMGLCRPFLVRYNGSHAGQDDGLLRVQSVSEPISTLDTSNRFGICQPLILPQDARGAIRTINQGLPTITATGAHALIQPFIVKYYGRSQFSRIDQPVDTVSTSEHFGLVRPMVVEINNQRYLLDILFRMLTPRELAAAHSFPADYHFTGTKTDIVTQIGNSVPVGTAQSLCEARLAA